VKIGPYFSALLPMARELEEAGADGLVLFNRFMQPDIDIESLEVEPDIQLSSPHELRLALRWIAILSGRVKLSLAATTGIHRAQDLIKALLVGADVGMIASALFRYGPKHPESMLTQLHRWMEDNEYESVAQLKGSLSHQHSPKPELFERANYMKALINYTTEIG
jgi:dihydroorotate dehydrogenase (fumarate)